MPKPDMYPPVTGPSNAALDAVYPRPTPPPVDPAYTAGQWAAGQLAAVGAVRQVAEDVPLPKDVPAKEMAELDRLKQAIEEFETIIRLESEHLRWLAAVRAQVTGTTAVMIGENKDRLLFGAFGEAEKLARVDAEIASAIKRRDTANASRAAAQTDYNALVETIKVRIVPVCRSLAKQMDENLLEAERSSLVLDAIARSLARHRIGATLGYSFFRQEYVSGQPVGLATYRQERANRL